MPSSPAHVRGHYWCSHLHCPPQPRSPGWDAVPDGEQPAPPCQPFQTKKPRAGAELMGSSRLTAHLGDGETRASRPSPVWALSPFQHLGSRPSLHTIPPHDPTAAGLGAQSRASLSFPPSSPGSSTYGSLCSSYTLSPTLSRRD